MNLGAAEFPQGGFTPPEDVKYKGTPSNLTIRWGGADDGTRTRTPIAGTSTSSWPVYLFQHIRKQHDLLYQLFSVCQPKVEKK